MVLMNITHHFQFHIIGYGVNGRIRIIIDGDDHGAFLHPGNVLIAREHPALASLRSHLAVAQDGVLVRANDPLRDGAELALLPPVSGG